MKIKILPLETELAQFWSGTFGIGSSFLVPVKNNVSLYGIFVH
jgi:hypothetical protein